MTIIIFVSNVVNRSDEVSNFFTIIKFVKVSNIKNWQFIKI